MDLLKCPITVLLPIIKGNMQSSLPCQNDIIRLKEWCKNQARICTHGITHACTHIHTQAHLKHYCFITLLPETHTSSDFFFYLLQSCLNKSAFLLTQMPLPHTVTDFWRLVYDQHVSTLVMMNNVTDDNDEVRSSSVKQMSCLMTKPIKWLCAQRRLRSAWASAVRSLGSLGPKLSSWGQRRLIRLDRCPGWSESLLHAHATLLILSWGGSFDDNKRIIFNSSP